MTNGNSLINLGEISKPATVLIEKISSAVGILYQPYQIKRIAKAEAEADKIRALSDIEISEIQKRAIGRLIQEEGKKQENIENITALSLPCIKEKAKPENIDDDWIAFFFDKCKLISDKEMQSLWGRLLAGEANQPGAFSKHTIELVSKLSKKDAQLFTKLCTFVWQIGRDTPIIFDTANKIYNDKHINFNSLSHLESIGLVRFDPVAGFIRRKLPKRLSVLYYKSRVLIEFQKDASNDLNIGDVLFTQIGQELAPISGSVKSDEFFIYTINKWNELGIKISITSDPTAYF